MGRTSDAKENIIQSAIELIGRRNYNDVGVQEICNQAGVKKGSFYHFFPSKSELTITALDRMWSDFKAGMLDPVYNSDLSAKQKFETLILKSQEYQKADTECKGCVTGCSIGNLALELSTQDQAIRQKIESIFKEWAGYLEKMIIDSVNEGDLPGDTDPKLTAEAILAYLEGIALLSKTFNDPDVLGRLSEGFAELCIRHKEVRKTA